MPQTKEVTECRIENYREEYEDEKLARIHVEITWVNEEIVTYDDHDERSGFARSNTDQEVGADLLFEKTGEKEIELAGFRATRSLRSNELDREHLRVLRTLEYGCNIVREHTGPQTTVVDVYSTINEQLEK